MAEGKIISKLINTCISIIQHLCHEIMKFAPYHKIWHHCLWTAYFLIRGFTLMYTLHHM